MTDEGGYGRFGALSRVELERFFYLDDEDRKLIAGRRRDYNRLGFDGHYAFHLPDLGGTHRKLRDPDSPD